MIDAKKLLQELVQHMTHDTNIPACFKAANFAMKLSAINFLQNKISMREQKFQIIQSDIENHHLCAPSHVDNTDTNELEKSLKKNLIWAITIGSDVLD